MKDKYKVRMAKEHAFASDDDLNMVKDKLLTLQELFDTVSVHWMIVDISGPEVDLVTGETFYHLVVDHPYGLA